MSLTSVLEPYADEIRAYVATGKSRAVTAAWIIKKHNVDIKLTGAMRYIERLANKDRIKDNHAALADECNTVGIPLDGVKHYWYKGKQFSIFVKGQEVTYEQLKDDIVKEMQEHSPKYKPIEYAVSNDGHLLVIDPADIHLNKLCSAFETSDECDHDIIYQRVKEGVRGIVEKANGFHIERILFVAGNDILHTDTPKNTTTAGTHQDVSLMWYDAFVLARKLLVECLEMLVTVAPIHFMYNPSNHDYQNGFFLAQTIEAWFSKSVNITFDVDMRHRKYFTYGENLIGSTHGDGAKDADLALLMAHEAPDWTLCKHRYYYTHHIHHKKSKDYMSVCVESLRSPSGTDSWHSKNGYQHAPKAVEGFIHHKKYGQIARLTHIF
jgi:hypothetical protein